VAICRQLLRNRYAVGFYILTTAIIKNSNNSKHISACSLLQVGFLLALFFYFEVDGDMFLRNVGGLSRRMEHVIHIRSL
jgi:hypothetical protein